MVRRKGDFDRIQGYSLKVSTHGIHLYLFNCNAAIINERCFVVVEIGRAITVRVVGNLQCTSVSDPQSYDRRQYHLMIVPCWNPGISCVR